METALILLSGEPLREIPERGAKTFSLKPERPITGTRAFSAMEQKPSRLSRFYNWINAALIDSRFHRVCPRVRTDLFTPFEPSGTCRGVTIRGNTRPDGVCDDGSARADTRGRRFGPFYRVGVLDRVCGRGLRHRLPCRMDDPPIGGPTDHARIGFARY